MLTKSKDHPSGTPSRIGWMNKPLLSPFKMKDHAITLNTQSSVKIGGQAVHVYMILNFHAAPYEICSHPPARPSWGIWPEATKKVRVESNALEVTGKPNAMRGIEMGFVCGWGDHSIPGWVQVLTGNIYRTNVYNLSILDMSTFCTNVKIRCVHYTSVCSMISIDTFMLITCVLFLSGKHM